LQSSLDNYKSLRLHSGIGTGRVDFLHVGGIHDRWELLLAGEALLKMGQAEGQAEVGEVCICSTTHALVAPHVEADLKQRRANNAVRVLNVLQHRAVVPVTSLTRCSSTHVVPLPLRFAECVPSIVIQSVSQHEPTVGCLLIFFFALWQVRADSGAGVEFSSHEPPSHALHSIGNS